MKSYNLVLCWLFCLFFSATSLSQTVLEWKKNNIYNPYGRANSNAICVGDINGDGFNDLLTNSRDSGLSWRKNIDGNGNFGNAITIVEDLEADALNIVDLDGDGFNDLVYRGDYFLTFNTTASHILWRKNLDGNGTFSEPVILNPSQYSSDPKVIDAEGDGDVDVFFLRSPSSTSSSLQLVLLKNNGNGTFAPEQVIYTTTGGFFAFIGNISGDNLVDVIMMSASMVYYQQNQDGTFTFTENLGTTSGAAGVTGADVNNDGDLDIIRLYDAQNPTTRRIKWYKNNNNVFANAADLITGTPSPLYNYTFEMQDVDNDGKADIVGRAGAQYLSTGTAAANALNEISWYKNLGNATFGAKQVISTAAPLNRTLHIGDINNDGNKDFVTSALAEGESLDNFILWLDNNSGNPSTCTPHFISDYINMPFVADVADIDASGTKDVLIASFNTEKLAWYENTDGIGGFFNFEKNIETSLGSYCSALAIDVNNDGHKDIVASSNVDTTNKIILLTNDGQNNFPDEQVLFIGGNNHTLITEDVDGDGDGDLIAFYSYGTGSSITSVELRVFKNNGNGFDPPSLFALNASNNFQSLKAVDIDADGDLDFLGYIGGTQSPRGLYWIENTDGQGSYTILHPTNIANVSSKVFDVGDFNADGLQDIIFIFTPPQSRANVGMVTINADTTFGARVGLFDPATGSTFNLIKLGDLDNDGDLDILSEYKHSQTSGSTNFFLWLENNGNGTVTYRGIESNTPVVATLNFLEDMDADGKLDFVTSYDPDFANSDVKWYKNLGLTVNQIKGKVSLDAALNGCSQGNIAAQQVLVSTTGNNSTISTFTSPNGSYSFKVNPGNYTTALSTTFPFLNAQPNQTDSNFTTNNGETIANFCLVPEQFYDDLELSFYPLNDARPGFTAEYQLIAKNRGTNPINTTVQLQYNIGKINFNSAVPNPISQTSNSLVFNIQDLQPFATYTATINFQVNSIPQVSIGEMITFSIDNALENDITTNNNSFEYRQQIVGSYDPNDMTCLEGQEVHIDNSDKYLHYIIRFQNTGNYFAERVLITTELRDKLAWETIALESSSHANRVEIIDGSLMKFTFDAIYLPAVSVNEAASNGFIAFKVKPKQSVVADDTVTGVASIYFDYNPAIVTNQVATTFVTTLGSAVVEDKPIGFYPNPVSSQLFLQNTRGNFKTEIYSTIGLLISTTENKTTLDFSNFSRGIYLIKITEESGKTNVLKVIKE